MSQGDSPQSRENRHVCRDYVGLGCKQKKNLQKKKFFKKYFSRIFFWLRTLPRHPPSTLESFTLMGLAMWESIRDQLGKSAVLSYQSLARYRSLGFDQKMLSIAPKGVILSVELCIPVNFLRFTKPSVSTSWRAAATRPR